MKKLISCKPIIKWRIAVEFFEPKIKQPIPLEKVRICFRVHKKFSKEKYAKDIKFNIENESVFYGFYETLNLNYFEVYIFIQQALIDRILLNKKVSNKTLILATNFESTRTIDLVGEKIKYYTDDEAEAILSNSASGDRNYFDYEETFAYRESNFIFKDIHSLWKALNPEKHKTITFEQFEKVIISLS